MHQHLYESVILIQTRITSILDPPQNDKVLDLLLDDDNHAPFLETNTAGTSLQPQVKSSSRHFDMREIIKAQKVKETKLKGRAKQKLLKKMQDAKFEGLQEGFKLDLDDPRFSALKESHHFAIDPSNPQ